MYLDGRGGGMEGGWGQDGGGAMLRGVGAYCSLYISTLQWYISDTKSTSEVTVSRKHEMVSCLMIILKCRDRESNRIRISATQCRRLTDDFQTFAAGETRKSIHIDINTYIQ